MKVGVILSRCQPLHKGHIEMINKALSENDQVLFIIGSADKSCTERNPFSISCRINMLKLALDYVVDKTRVNLITLKDLSSDNSIPKQSNKDGSVDDALLVNKEWGMYLYYNIVNAIGQKDFTFYYNDDSSLVSAWFPNFIWGRITLNSSFRLDNISSSTIRDAMHNKDKEYLKKCLPYLQGDVDNMLTTYNNIIVKEEL
jgi:cytidyltransferase-like protein